MTAGAAILLLLLSLAACGGSKKFYELGLMPAQDIYDQAEIDPFEDLETMEKAPCNGMLYATDRATSRKEGEVYKNARGHVLRLGIGAIELDIESIALEKS